ncbi:MAG: TorD/DmsD family molecular chaperone, partial [Burkholderiales bacterium]
EEAESSRLREEYDQLFIGVGKPDVMLYGSYYLSGFLMEKPLAKLREDLLKLGLSRRQSVGEPEDHISALSETMRLLVMGQGHFPPASLETQKDFFHRHLEPWYRKLTAALVENKVSEFYRRAGSFIQAFFEVETESFEIA